MGEEDRQCMATSMVEIVRRNLLRFLLCTGLDSRAEKHCVWGWNRRIIPSIRGRFRGAGTMGALQRTSAGADRLEKHRAVSLLRLPTRDAPRCRGGNHAT